MPGATQRHRFQSGGASGSDTTSHCKTRVLFFKHTEASQNSTQGRKMMSPRRAFQRDFVRPYSSSRSRDIDFSCFSVRLGSAQFSPHQFEIETWYHGHKCTLSPRTLSQHWYRNPRLRQIAQCLSGQTLCANYVLASHCCFAGPPFEEIRVSNYLFEKSISKEAAVAFKIVQGSIYVNDPSNSERHGRGTARFEQNGKILMGHGTCDRIHIIKVALQQSRRATNKSMRNSRGRTFLRMWDLQFFPVEKWEVGETYLGNTGLQF